MASFFDFLNGGIQSTPEAPPGMPTAPQSASDNPIRQGIDVTAKALGISPIDLATVISYETGGTFDPTKAGPRTQWGQHRGLIQFGEPQAKEHGVDWNNPVGSQLGENGAVASYLRKAGVKPGMGLLDIYSAINAGAPGLYDRSDANNGGAPGTVRDKVERQMAGHRAKAEALFGAEGGAPLNPTITAAAERGRGPAADRIGRGMAYAEGPAGGLPVMPQPMQDTTTPDNGGVLEFLRQQQGQGGLGGLGGMRPPSSAPPGIVIPGGGQPQQGVESLIPFNKPNPFAFMGEALQENQQAELKNKGAVFAAKQLVAQGMSPQDAVAAVYSPQIGQTLALGGMKQRREAAVNADVAARLATGAAPADATGATQPDAIGRPSAQPVQPEQAIAPTAKIDTGNKTVDALFSQRDAKLKEYRAISDNMIRASTDEAKAAVQARLKSIETEIGGIDKRMEQYLPTGTMKEYTYAMKQRQDRGEPPVPFEQWDPDQGKKDAVAARGAAPDEVSSLRKEIQGLPSYKNMSQAAPIYKSMMETVGRNTKASDLNLVYGLGKIMDPTSVVREGEMVLVKNAAGLSEKLLGAIEALTGGAALTPTTRAALMQEAHSRMQSYDQLYKQDIGQYRGIATDRKMNPAHAIPDFGEFKPYEPPKAAGDTTPQYKVGATATGRDGTKRRFDGKEWVPFQ